MQPAVLIGFGVYFAVLLALAVPLGRYLFRVMEGLPTALDPILGPVERLTLRLAGIAPGGGQSWLAYLGSFLAANAGLMLFTYGVLRLQAVLPLRQTAVADLSPALAFNTAASFVANCNWQAYAGERLSYLSQLVLMVNQFLSPAFGVAVAIAFVRGLTARRAELGHFGLDLVRLLVRLYLPLAAVAAVVLGLLGVPQTFGGPVTAHILGGGVQVLDRGPVAAFEAIKMLGNNGGGFFNANSAHPLENPSAASNGVETLLMSLVPVALVFTFGEYARSRKMAWVLSALSAVLLAAGVLWVYASELSGNPVLRHLLGVTGPNLEGHELRFGQGGTALFVAATTAFTTGAVNAMHDSLIPASGLTPLVFMMLNAVFGAAGAGLLNILTMVLVTLFIAGLMVGRTPELLGKKIEAREIKLATVAVLIHPFLILVPTALALSTRAGTQGILNPGFHGLSEVLYAYASAAANNGSAFAGLNANTAFFNDSLGAVILVGRYLSLMALLALAGSMAGKVPAPVGEGTLRTDTWTFGAVYLGTVLIVGALTFLPALSLGPIAEQLILNAGHRF